MVCPGPQRGLRSQDRAGSLGQWERQEYEEQDAPWIAFSAITLKSACFWGLSQVTTCSPEQGPSLLHGVEAGR